MAKAKSLQLNPLNANDLAAAKASQATAEALIEYWSKCKDCTMDVKPLIEHATALRDFAAGVVRNFSSGVSDG